jgi:DNA-binding transcriptional LysR family regulator
MFSALQYRAIVAVAQTGSIKGAAEVLHRSPSAVSMIITQLEDRVGAPLFETSRKNELTEIGSYIVSEARSLIEHEDRVARGIHAFVEGRSGHLDVACIPSVANIFLPEAVERLWNHNFSLNIRVRDSDSRTVAEMVETDRSELGVGTAIDLSEDLVFAPLFSDDLAAVCSVEHPLAKAKLPLDWAALRAHRFIGNSSYLSILTPALSALALTEVAYIPNITSLLSIIRSGVGVTILPKINRLHSGDGVTFLNVGDEPLRRNVGIITRRGRTLSPGARRFLQVLADVVSSHSVKEGLELTLPETGAE